MEELEFMGAGSRETPKGVLSRNDRVNFDETFNLYPFGFIIIWPQDVSAWNWTTRLNLYY